MMKAVLEQGENLFNLDKKYALVHCVSQDCNMDVGIAVLFKKTFPDLQKYCQRVIHTNHLNYPCVIPYMENDRTVFTLITKKYYYDKPTYENVVKTIKGVAFMCKQFNIKFLGMPRIGYGLDKLEWNKVRTIIQETFKELDIKVQIIFL